MVGDSELLHQRLEGAILAVVGKRHIEQVIGNRRWIVFEVVAEDKPGLRVDESANELV